MKRLLTLVAFFATLEASAQQVNPVPDYVFANRMSAGRNTVTDTAAYFSIGPRYGATRGMMPPMVVDTASFSGNKRNGLLIFSVQKNKFLYWDSVGVKWAEMAGTAGTALTSADTAALLSTRAWRQKGIDSLAAIRIAGSGTTNYVPKFTATNTVSNSQIFDNGTNVGIGTDTPRYQVQINETKNTSSLFITTNGVNTANDYTQIGFGNISNASTIASYIRTSFVDPASHLATYFSFGTTNTSNVLSESMRIDAFGNIGVGLTPSPWRSIPAIQSNYGILSGNLQSNILLNAYYDGSAYKYIGTGEAARYRQDAGVHSWLYASSGTANNNISFTQGMTLNTSSELLINTTSDQGDYKLQVSGNIYNNGNAILAAITGNVGIGTTSPGALLDISATTAYLQFTDETTSTSERNFRVGISEIGEGDFYIEQETGDETNAYKIKLYINLQGDIMVDTTFDAGDYKFQVNGNIYNTGSITTGAPSGGSIKPWKVGEAASVSPTSPNRTLRVEVDGVVYYIHAKTTND